ncbi:MAG: PDZ domain-containing protein, partial [Deltaproteobacteria bacterium]
MRSSCRCLLFLSFIVGAQQGAFARTCPDFATIAASVQPGVVSVLVELEKPGDADAGFVPLFSDDTAPFGRGLGSGFVVSDDGLIVTCHHVVAGAKGIKVRLWGGSRAIAAKIVGTAPEADLALLKIDTKRRLHPLRLGDSDAVEVGQWVVAVGNPLGMTSVVTKGIISGLGRSLEDLPMPGKGYSDFIQTDASIDLGNSGGPLVNLRAEVVGINTAMNASGRGISFAVPVNLLKALMPQLLKDGRHTRAFLGIRIERYIPKENSAGPSIATAGVLITKIIPGSPAHRAGLEAGDLLVRLGPFAVKSVADAVWKVSTLPVGVKSPVEFLRGGRRQR